jgi:hypothetical protein
VRYRTGSSSSYTRPYPPVGYVSSHAPLLSILHSRLTEYEDAISHAHNVAENLGHSRHIEPPSADMVARMKRTSASFDAVLQHVDAVDAHLDHNFILLNRDVVSPTNALYMAPPSIDEDEDRKRTLRTSSPILANATTLNISFRPFPSAEVMVQSAILAHSAELRALASPEWIMNGV